MTELPPGWTTAPLSDLGAEVRGSVVPSAGTSYELYSVPTYPTGRPELVDGSVIGSAKRPVEAGDILLCKINPRINRVWAVADPGREVTSQIASTEYLVLRMAHADLGPYVMWYLRSPRFRDWIKLSVEGATGSHTRAKSAPILRQAIPLPPLNEQRRIVAAIEEHFTRLDAAQSSLADAQQRLTLLRRAAIDESLSGAWERAPLAEIADVITKGTTPTSIGHRFTVDGILFVKAESLESGLVDHSRCARISPEADEALRRSRLAAGDVLVTIAGTLGRVGIVREVDLPANTNQAVSIIRLREPSMTPWVSTWLRGSVAQRELLTGGRGVGLQNLNLKQVGAVSVPLPPVEEQRRIVVRVDEQLSAIDALRAAIERAQRRSESLRRAVLERAFRGELMPQDPSDEPASVLLERVRAERAAAPAPSRRRKVSA